MERTASAAASQDGSGCIRPTYVAILDTPCGLSFGPRSFSTDAATRSGASAPIVMEMIAPIEVPTNTARGISSLSIIASTSWA